MKSNVFLKRTIALFLLVTFTSVETFAPHTKAATQLRTTPRFSHVETMALVNQLGPEETKDLLGDNVSERNRDFDIRPQRNVFTKKPFSFRSELRHLAAQKTPEEWYAVAETIRINATIVINDRPYQVHQLAEDIHIAEKPEDILVTLISVGLRQAPYYSGWLLGTLVNLIQHQQAFVLGLTRGLHLTASTSNFASSEADGLKPPPLRLTEWRSEQRQHAEAHAAEWYAIMNRVKPGVFVRLRGILYKVIEVKSDKTTRLTPSQIPVVLGAVSGAESYQTVSMGEIVYGVQTDAVSIMNLGLADDRDLSERSELREVNADEGALRRLLENVISARQKLKEAEAERKKGTRSSRHLLDLERSYFDAARALISGDRIEAVALEDESVIKRIQAGDWLISAESSPRSPDLLLVIGKSDLGGIRFLRLRTNNAGVLRHGERAETKVLTYRGNLLHRFDLVRQHSARSKTATSGTPAEAHVPAQEKKPQPSGRLLQRIGHVIPLLDKRIAQGKRFRTQGALAQVLRMRSKVLTQLRNASPEVDGRIKQLVQPADTLNDVISPAFAKKIEAAVESMDRLIEQGARFNLQKKMAAAIGVTEAVLSQMKHHSSEAADRINRLLTSLPRSTVSSSPADLLNGIHLNGQDQAEQPTLPNLESLSAPYAPTFHRGTDDSSMKGLGQPLNPIDSRTAPNENAIHFRSEPSSSTDRGEERKARAELRQTRPDDFGTIGSSSPTALRAAPTSHRGTSNPSMNGLGQSSLTDENKSRKARAELRVENERGKIQTYSLDKKNPSLIIIQFLSGEQVTLKTKKKRNGNRITVRLIGEDSFFRFAEQPDGEFKEIRGSQARPFSIRPNVTYHFNSRTRVPQKSFKVTMLESLSDSFQVTVEVDQSATVQVKPVPITQRRQKVRRPSNVRRNQRSELRIENDRDKIQFLNDPAFVKALFESDVLTEQEKTAIHPWLGVDETGSRDLPPFEEDLKRVAQKLNLNIGDLRNTAAQQAIFHAERFWREWKEADGLRSELRSVRKKTSDAPSLGTHARQILASAPQKITLTVQNFLGIHMMPSIKIVKLATHPFFNKMEILVEREGFGPVSARDFIQVARLDSKKDSEVTFTLNPSGEENELAQAVFILAIKRLIEDEHFGESLTKDDRAEYPQTETETIVKESEARVKHMLTMTEERHQTADDLPVSTQIHSEFRMAMVQITGRLPIPSEGIRQALQARLMPVTRKLAQNQVIGILPHLGRVPDLVTSVVNNLDAGNRVVIFVGTKREAENLEPFFPVDLLKKGQIVITTQVNVQEISRGQKVELVAFGLPEDGAYADRVSKLIGREIPVVKRIASIDQIEEDLGLVGIAENLRSELRTRWRQAIAA
ncbi:MAG: hypothetical protein COW12_07170 [Candidatus Omnitrophica bacterium CG12_big_fil_rev_8_21_14_0_65_45_16]|nr:MAG: hypothetical protein COW12_07170 [Candidatus Omnitrophica bacterium CG12_big_fil_rev_8_21_14_0_65_45_16]